jgi:hypothetical protein
MRKLLTSLGIIALGFFAFTATAAAAGEISPEDGSLLDLARPVYDAVVHGQYWLGASLALVLAVAAFRKYAPGKAGAWARTDVGGSLLVLAASFGGAAATGLLAAGTNAMTGELAWTALKVALAAAGGYSLAKKLLAPVLRKIADKAPPWMKPLFAMLLWSFETPIAKAETAGDVAVAENPPTGTDGATGTTTTEI